MRLTAKSNHVGILCADGSTVVGPEMSLFASVPLISMNEGCCESQTVASGWRGSLRRNFPVHSEQHWMYLGIDQYARQLTISLRDVIQAWQLSTQPERVMS